MLHCKECEKFMRFGGDDKHGVCSLPESYFQTEADAECVYLRKDMLTCSDCARFKEDFACMTAAEDDDASDCPGFIDKFEENVLAAFFEWLKRGEYNREKIEALCKSFEETEAYQFVMKHQENENASL